MNLLINHANCQVAGFAVATIGWILTLMSMGLVEWQVWYLMSTAHLAPHLICVGMWKVCVYHHASHFGRTPLCYRYTYRDTYLPVNIRIGQRLLLAASILGLLGKVSFICTLRKLYVGILQRKSICCQFVVSGILNTAAGTCIIIAVVWSYNSMMNGEGIPFPPSSHLPFKPDMWEVGNAMRVAGLAAFMMMFSGLFHLSFKYSICSQVHPEASEM